MHNNYTKEQVIRWAIEYDLYIHVRKAIAHYGLDGTEEAIKRVYSAMPKLRKNMLRVYKEIINGKEAPTIEDVSFRREDE